MTIRWSPGQRAQVASVLKTFPAKSSLCADAARQILPVARELEPGAHAVLMEPAGDAVYIDWHRGWTHHVTVEVQAHYVDALTDADGHAVADYLQKYFPETAAYLKPPSAVDLDKRNDL